MNEDEMQALEPQAGAELERQLARYARVRLDPTTAQARRARASVMEAAWRRRLERVQAPERPTAGPRRRAPFAAWSVRRMATSLSAAVLAGLLVGSVTFAGSRAGGPLYEARLQLEALTLPTDPDARLEAELAQAQSRLAEVVEAAGRNDQGALDAALGAYDSAIDGLSTANGVPADRALEAVQFHRMVLLRLVDTAPVQALGGLENALSHSSSVIDRLGAAGTGAGADAGPGGPGGNDAGTSGTGNDGGPNAGGNGGSNAGGNGGSNAGGNGGSNKGGGNAATPAPTERPAPSRAPAPGKAPKPAASPDNGPGQDSP